MPYFSVACNPHLVHIITAPVSIRFETRPNQLSIDACAMAVVVHIVFLWSFFQRGVWFLVERSLSRLCAGGFSFQRRNRCKVCWLPSFLEPTQNTAGGTQSCTISIKRFPYDSIERVCLLLIQCRNRVRGKCYTHNNIKAVQL